MNEIFENATEAFEYWYQFITHAGVQHENTKAAYNIGFYITNPKERIITTPWRKFSQRYAEREYAWYCSGNRSVAEIKKYAPIWDKMHGGDNIVNSNYGWQWMRNNQLLKCIEQLKKDLNTRQAWFSIFDGKEKDNYAFDTPCTMAVGFDVVRDKLNMTVLMRSCDLVYGFCNDQYCWTRLLEETANELSLNMGTYYHYAHNLHIYSDFFNMQENYYKNLKNQ